MRVGLVCPFSLDVPGGVQAHVMELATELMRRGHEVRVLAPASQTLALPPWGRPPWPRPCAWSGRPINT